MRSEQKLGIAVGALFTLGVLWADAYLLYCMVTQLYSEFYRATPGEVQRCEVIERDNRRVLDLRYVYTIDGRQFEGTKYSLGFVPEGKLAGVVAAYPLGPAQPERVKTFMTTVYYDPLNPRNAVLEKGADGRLFAFAMFLAPLTLLLIAGFRGLFRSLQHRKRLKENPSDSDEACPLQVIRQSNGLIAVRLTPVLPLLSACVTMVLSSIVLWVGIAASMALATHTKVASPLIASLAWAASAAFGYHVFRVSKKEEARGRFDLRINPATGFLLAPNKSLGTVGNRHPRESITAFGLKWLGLWPEVEPDIAKISEIKAIEETPGPNGVTQVRFRLAGDCWAYDHTPGFETKEEAQAYAAWLHRELKLPPAQNPAGAGCEPSRR